MRLDNHDICRAPAGALQISLGVLASSTLLSTCVCVVLTTIMYITGSREASGTSPRVAYSFFGCTWAAVISKEVAWIVVYTSARLASL